MSITLITKGGERVQVPAEISELSILIQNVLEDGSYEEEIPIEFVPFRTLQSILEYCEHHTYICPPAIERPVRTSLAESVSDSWDVEYIAQFSFEGLVELMLACNFLDLKCLLDLCMASVACHFKGRRVDELRAEFGITEEFTEAEERKIMNENPWVTEDRESRLKAGR